MTQEATDPLDVNWRWETFYNIDFCFVHLNGTDRQWCMLALKELVRENQIGVET